MKSQPKNKSTVSDLAVLLFVPAEKEPIFSAKFVFLLGQFNKILKLLLLIEKKRIFVQAKMLKMKCLDGEIA